MTMKVEEATLDWLVTEGLRSLHLSWDLSDTDAVMGQSE